MVDLHLISYWLRLVWNAIDINAWTLQCRSSWYCFKHTDFKILSWSMMYKHFQGSIVIQRRTHRPTCCWIWQRSIPCPSFFLRIMVNVFLEFQNIFNFLARMQQLCRFCLSRSQKDAVVKLKQLHHRFAGYSFLYGSGCLESASEQKYQVLCEQTVGVCRHRLVTTDTW